MEKVDLLQTSLGTKKRKNLRKPILGTINPEQTPAGFPYLHLNLFDKAVVVYVE